MSQSCRFCSSARQTSQAQPINNMNINNKVASAIVFTLVVAGAILIKGVSASEEIHKMEHKLTQQYKNALEVYESK